MSDNNNEQIQGLSNAKIREIGEWVKNIKEELECMKEELQATQANPDMNFSSAEFVEGSEYYISMTSALRSCIDTIESGSFNELYGKLIELDNAVNNYHSRREGLVLDAEYSYVYDRVDTTMTAKIVIPNMINYLQKLQDLSSELFESKIADYI